MTWLNYELIVWINDFWIDEWWINWWILKRSNGHSHRMPNDWMKKMTECQNANEKMTKKKWLNAKITKWKMTTRNDQMPELA